MIKILIFDMPTKVGQFKEYAGKSNFIEYFGCHHVKQAMSYIRANKPEIIVLGGDVNDDKMRAVSLYYQLEEWDLHRKSKIYITTWNADEARILRNMSKAFYAPHSKAMAKIIANMARTIRKKKEKKKCRKEAQI